MYPVSLPAEACCSTRLGSASTLLVTWASGAILEELVTPAHSSRRSIAWIVIMSIVLESESVTSRGRMARRLDTGGQIDSFGWPTLGGFRHGESTGGGGVLDKTGISLDAADCATRPVVLDHPPRTSRNSIAPITRVDWWEGAVGVARLDPWRVSRAIYSGAGPRPLWPQLPQLNSTRTLVQPDARRNVSAESAGGRDGIDKAGLGLDAAGYDAHRYNPRKVRRSVHLAAYPRPPWTRHQHRTRMPAQRWRRGRDGLYR